MSLVIKKFGGTSVGSLERIRNAASLVRDFLITNPGTKTAVVVSAMAGETNRLIQLARSCTPDPSPRELDALMATGEQASTALFAMALISLGVPARSLDAQQAMISTNARHLGAQIERIQTTRLEEVIAAGEVPVVAGFQGVNEAGDITTLGRGGSDITAVALAAALKAQSCYIYTDVAGVYSSDPRLCPRTRLLSRISHEEMLELASLGAKVLHPRSVYFAMYYQVPLVVLSTFKPGAGTWIVREEDLMEKPVVTGITYRTDETRINVQRLPGGTPAISRLFEELARFNIFVDMITQTGVDGDLTDLGFTVPDENSSEALQLVQRVLPDLGAQGASIERDIAKVSVVGIGMRYHSGVAARLFRALADERIDSQMISTSDIKISIVIPRKYCEMAVRSLHEAFIEMEPAVQAES